MYSEKRDLRPYILGLCFFWGLVAGFIAYRTSESAAQAHTRELEKIKIEELERVKNIKPKTVEVAPIFRPVGENITPDEKFNTLTETNNLLNNNDLAQAMKSRDFRSIPASAPAPLRTEFGLNAKTTPRPSKPEKTVNFRPTKITPKNNIDDLPLPDIE